MALNKTGRIKLRNKIEAFLNNHPDFGCRVHSGISPAPKKRVRSKERHYWRFVTGTAKDGRTILILPILTRNERVPVSLCEYLEEIAVKSPYVGMAENLGDVFCIIMNDPVEYPRDAKTTYWRYWLKRSMEKNNVQPSDESE